MGCCETFGKRKIFVHAWMTLSCTENYLVELFYKITTVKERLTLLKLLMKCAILTTIVN
jgi:hypothetical protein